MLILGFAQFRAVADSGTLNSHFGASPSASLSHGSRAQDSRDVLVLYPQEKELGSFSDLDRNLRIALQAGFSDPVVFYTEYLDLLRFPDKASQDRLVKFLSTKYSDRELDLIVCVGSMSFNFMEERKDLFKGIPIVFTSVNIRTVEKHRGRIATGVAVKRDFRDTVELALRLQPNTAHVFIPVGSSPMEQNWRSDLESDLSIYKDRLQVTFLTQESIDETLHRVENLPPQSIIVFGSLFYFDSAGHYFLPDEALGLICQHSNSPVYAINEWDLGTGIVGGHLYELRDVGTATGEIGHRVLAGTNPKDIPIQTLDPNHNMFDARQLSRWNISEARLPTNSIVEFRHRSAWQLYKPYIIAAVALLITETLLVLGLFWERARRRKVQRSLVAKTQDLTASMADLAIAHAELSESEGRFRLVANTAPVMIWMSGPDKLCTYFNQPWMEFTGRSLDAELGEGWTEGVDLEDRQSCLETYCTSFELRRPFEMEYRLRRYDAEYRWILDVGVPRFGADGTFSGYIGCAIDITDRKNAEEFLATAQRKLLAAQEQERSRIARDLHDDINQRVVMLIHRLDNIADLVVEPDALPYIQDACDETRKLSLDIQNVSHQLHSSTLHHLGLGPAIRGLCDVFSRQHGIKVEHVAHDLPRNIDQEASLAIFRVLQEALQNVSKHSKARTVRLELTADDKILSLHLGDDGVGFDMTRSNGGLGLTSMCERIRLVGGECRISSQPSRGTQVDVTIHLPDAIPSVVTETSVSRKAS
jgi:PAS domain S-box-containing protein